MKKNVIKLNESQLRYMINEAVKGVLKEGLASPSLKQLAKEHGGISYVDKSLQLDKLNADFRQGYFQSNFLVTDNMFGLKNIISQFFDREPIVRFKDGASVYKVKDEYMNDEKVKDMIARYKESSSELRDKRNDGIEPGKGEDWETDDEGRTRHYSYAVSPESMRQAKHKTSRGEGKPEAKGSDKDYEKYVIRYLTKKYNGNVKRQYDMEGKNYEDIIVVPRSEGIDFRSMANDFEKYGYGYDKPLSTRKAYVFRKGEEVDELEIDDPGMYPEYMMPVTREVNAPKIGTEAFNKK